MGVYTPKAGSIGHVAVTDEDFERCQWIFGKHEISGAFGINALDYWTQYQLQVAQFKEIRDQTIFDLIEDPLNEDQTRLRKGLREKLRNWMGILQLCEDIIIYCENINGMDTGNSEEGQAHRAISFLAPPEPTEAIDRHMTRPIETLLTDTSTSRSPMVTSGNREPNSSLRTDSKSSGSFHKIRRLFPRRRAVHQRDATQAAQAPENEHGVTDKTADGHLATSSVSAAQDQTSSIKNERWREKRAEFCDLLKELRQHFVLFSQEVEPKQSKSVAAGLLETAQADSELIRYRSGGDKLQALIQCLRKKPQQSHMAFQLLLQSDPFDFRSTLSSISPTCKDHFQEESAAFYLRLSLEKGSSTMADTALLSSATSQITDPEFKFFVFDVSHKSEASKVGTEIDDLRLLFEPKTTQPETDDWATFYGHVGENVRVISDSTIHLPQQSFAGCLIDCAEKDILRKPAYAGMRAELAFVVASSLFYNLQAEGLHDVDATELHYYTAFNDKKQEPDYVESRILPYVSLNTLGSTTVSPSSSDALSRATKSDLEERMMKKLGILIYEIGAWDRVIRRELQERVTHVTDAKEFLREEISSKYRDVIHACLAYKKSDDIGKWMIQNVILPLEEVYKSIKSGELRF